MLNKILSLSKDKTNKTKFKTNNNKENKRTTLFK